VIHLIVALNANKPSPSAARKRWVQRGQFAVEVEVEVIVPADDPNEACLEPTAVRWLDEIAQKAQLSDVEYLRKVGRVFPAVAG